MKIFKSLILATLFVLTASPAMGSDVSHLMKEIAKLESNLNSLYLENASQKDIRKVRLILDERRNELEKILQEQENTQQDFKYLTHQLEEAYREVGPYSAAEVFNNRMKGKVVELRGVLRVLDYESAGSFKTSQSLVLMPSYRTPEDFDLMGKRVYYSKNSKEIIIPIILSQSHAVKKYDYSRLLGKNNQIVRIEGVMPDLFERNWDDTYYLFLSGQDTRSQFLKTYNGKVTRPYIENIYLEDWVIK